MPHSTPSTRSDIAVIGAGIVGVCVALKLQEQGRQVLLIDRDHPGAATSFGNAGLIERSSVFPYAFPRDWSTLIAYALQKKTAAHYHWKALASLMPWLVGYWRHSSPHLYPAAIAGALPLIENSWTEHAPLIEAAGVSRLVNQNGWIKVWRHQDTEQASLDQAKQSLAYGLSVKVLSNSELQIKEPGLDPALIGGVHYPDSRQIHDPQALTTAYLNLFLQRGGRFIRGDAQSLQRDGQRWQVTTDEGPHSADAAVVALGPWGEDLAQKLGYQLKMGRKRGYHMHFAARGTAPTHVIVDVDNGYALAPMQQGIRLTTGAEFALRDAPPTPVQLDRIEPIARTLYSLGARLDQQAWMGSRPCTIDMLPVLGPAPKHPGLWFCFGHAHHGLTQAAASARLLAEMICGRETFADPKPYRVDRF